MDIATMYENTDLTIAAIAAELGLSFKPVYTYIRSSYSKEYQLERKKRSYSLSKRGSKNPCYGNTAHNANAQPKSDSKGYLLVVKPAWFAGRVGSRHVFQHSAIWCAFSGRTAVPAGYCIHHCDQDKVNNSYQNLICVSLRDHQKLHAWLEGATTISKESTAKWLEAHGTDWYL